MQILRVFPGKRNQYTPDDELVYCACNSLDLPFKESFPEFDEIHVSCQFTWDKKFSEELAFQLEAYGKPVKLGGVAFSSPCDGFQQGMYLHKDVTFTSRGCNNNCPWCVVPKLEGKLKEIEIQQGRIIQDNNFLQCSKSHKDKVFEMLKTQRKICFKGGLEVDLIDDHFINAAKGLRISEIWLACDTDARLPEFKKACKKLSDAGFSRKKLDAMCFHTEKIWTRTKAGQDKSMKLEQCHLCSCIEIFRTPRQFTAPIGMHGLECGNAQQPCDRTWKKVRISRILGREV